MNERGVSLIELCVVTAMITIVVGVSLPSWATLVAKYQHRAIESEIASELRMARQLAIVRRERIRVVVDVDRSELRTECVDCGMGPLRRYDFSRKGTVISSMTTGPEVVFQPSGRSATATTIILFDRNQTPHRLTVSMTGRVVLS